jgi:adenylate cyclase
MYERLVPRALVTLLPLAVVLLHIFGILRLGLLDKMDQLIYDGRLLATMPRSLDDRIVIVDIDEKSLAEQGRWPWQRSKLAAVTEELFGQQQVAVVGFDIVFAEPDDSSGLSQLRNLASGPLKHLPEFSRQVQNLTATLDNDARFAASLRGRPAVLGYYFTSDRGGRKSGHLPPPAFDAALLRGAPIAFTTWSGYGANLPHLADAAASSGFFNAITDDDGVVRSVPLLAQHEGQHYESLALAIFRQLLESSSVEPSFPPARFLSKGYQGLESVVIKWGGGNVLAIPVDQRVSSLVPYRNRGGPSGGAFQYVSATDLLSGRVASASLKDKIVLVGTTAPGLLDLRVTPVGLAYPGVEVHANLLSAFLDGRMLVKPDYSLGYQLSMALVVGVLLAFALPLLSALRATLLSFVLLLALGALDLWLYTAEGLVLPLASTLFVLLSAFALNMSYGYFVESRSKRDLANLFGTYVPPELVGEMLKDPDSYTMQAESRELTVMFCDMRGFTQLSEKMEPTQLQALLNSVFSRLTHVVRTHRGTIDKYMGDCIMAFWGAPVHTGAHATLAVQAALAMVDALNDLNREHAAKGWPPVGVGIGLNTGTMFVGDMGSDIRRSYTVMGDAVNLASRLEGLTRHYGVDCVISETTRQQAHGFVWQELDSVSVKGRENAVTVYSVLRPVAGSTPEALQQELTLWGRALKSYRAQDWEACEVHLLNLSRLYPRRPQYDLYAERVRKMRASAPDSGWDGITRFESK